MNRPRGADRSTVTPPAVERFGVPGTHPNVAEGHTGGDTSETLRNMTAPAKAWLRPHQPRTRWYTCISDRVAEVPHLIVRHAWHLLFDPTPTAIKFRLAWFANPDAQRVYNHRRRVTALACMLRRIERGGRRADRAVRRLHRWPYMVSELEVLDAQTLAAREVEASKNWMFITPRDMGDSGMGVVAAALFGTYAVFAALAHAWAMTLMLTLASAVFAFMCLGTWLWRQGYRDGMWQSMSAEAVERQRDVEQWAAERQRDEEDRRRATAPCDLDVRAMPAVQGEGYLYVIQFSTGAIKVGQTRRHPRARLAEHRRDAAVYGVNITRQWVSRPHMGFLRTEAALIDACLLAKGRQFRREYFNDIAFDVAVGFADRLVLPCRLAETERAAR